MADQLRLAYHLTGFRDTAAFSADVFHLAEFLGAHMGDVQLLLSTEIAAKRFPQWIAEMSWCRNIGAAGFTWVAHDRLLSLEWFQLL